MGEEADGILYSFGLSDNRKKYNAVLNKSEAHFVKRKKPCLRRKRALIYVDKKKENL